MFDRSRGVAYQPANQRIHLRLSDPPNMPINKPATIAINTADRGLCSIVVSRSLLAPATTSCALLAVSETFRRVLSAESKTVFDAAAVCLRINSDTEDVNFVTSSRRAARSAAKDRKSTRLNS